MAFFIDKATGAPQHVELNVDIYKAAQDEGVTVPNYINRKYQSVDTAHGSAFKQLCASEGLVLPDNNEFGIRAATMADILDGKAGMNAATPSNNSDKGSPFGSAARVLAPVAIIDLVEDVLQKDLVTDTVTFDQMVGQDITIPTENFIQPVVSYATTGGPNEAKAQRVTEFAEPGSLLRIGTSEKIRSLPSFSMGIEFSDKAQRALTIDVIAASVARFVAVERDSRVYGFISSLFAGDADLCSGAVSAVDTTTLDSACTVKTITHKAWVKFLARNRKYRNITHLICDIDAYLAIEGRTGRPGSTAYDPTLARIDPQARAMNVGFGNDVKYMIVDAAADGGPVPANNIYALDAAKAITRVTNSSAAFAASEAFVTRRSTMMRWDWGVSVYRTHGDSELKPFDVLNIVQS